MPTEVATTLTKPRNGVSKYWLRLHNGQEIPCTQWEYEAARLALNSGGFHVVNINQRNADYNS